MIILPAASLPPKSLAASGMNSSEKETEKNECHKNEPPAITNNVVIPEVDSIFFLGLKKSSFPVISDLNLVSTQCSLVQFRNDG